MEHKPFQRLVPGANCAILFVHGIVGSPDHFDILLPLVPKYISVQNILLDGHGKTAIDFSRTSMKKWVSQVSSAVDNLALSHENIYIVAHSMGTLFAIEQAVKKKCIKALFLLAVPILVGPKPRMISNAWKVFGGNIRPDDPFGNAARAACSITVSKNPFHYLGWIIRYLELFQKIGQARKLLPSLDTSCTAIQSRYDEMVSRRSAAYLNSHSSMNVFVLENSYHYLYNPDDKKFVLNHFQKFIDEIK